MRLIVWGVFFVTTLFAGGEIALTGTVVSDGQKMIGSRYMGYVKEVYVKLGDKVKREDDLYEIESAEFDILKTQADLMLEQAKITVEYWRDKLNNINEKKSQLKNKKNIPFGMDLDDMETQATNINAMLESAQIMVKQSSEKAKQLSTVYNYLKMKAPSDGVVVKRNIKVGDMVMPGMLTIMLIDIDNLEVDVDISENILSKVKIGQKVKVEIPSLEYKTQGTVKAIIPDANPMTHKINMRVHFDKTNDSIFPGMYAKVRISYER